MRTIVFGAGFEVELGEDWSLLTRTIHGKTLPFDDLSVGVSAVNYMETGHLGPTMWNHPNLRNIFVYCFIWLFGEGVWGIKGASLMMGTLSVPVLALLTNRIFRCREIAYIAALFLALDALHIDFSRQAVHEVYMMFFALSGIYFSLMFLDGRHPVWLIFSAVLFGLGIASKWYVLFPLLVTLIYLIYNAANTSEKGKYFRIYFITTTLIIVPLTVYLVTFLPWVIHGHDLYELFKLQYYMYAETVTHGGYSPYDMELDHRAYLWFIKPVAYVSVAVQKGVPSIFAGISNPLVWLLTIPSMIYLYSKGERERNGEYFFLLGLFILTYIPVLSKLRLRHLPENRNWNIHGQQDNTSTTAPACRPGRISGVACLSCYPY